MSYLERLHEIDSQAPGARLDETDKIPRGQREPVLSVLAGSAPGAFERASDLKLPAATVQAIDAIARADAWSAADRIEALRVAALYPDPADWLKLAKLVRASKGA